MNANTFGNRFVVTSFGESHGSAMGVVIDGCPAGVVFDENLLLTELQRRRPGQGNSTQKEIVSARQEEDHPEILSGVFENKTIGTPIAILVRNKDQRTAEYNEIKDNPRAGHADDVWKNKFSHSDHRGGGRASGRETISRVMAGAVAKMLLKQVSPECQIIAYSSKVGPFEISSQEETKFLNEKLNVDNFVARFPGANQTEIRELLVKAKEQGQSYGGIAKILVQAPPPNLGQPVFHKLKADLASALMGIGAVSAVEIGDGFASANQVGTDFHSGKTQVYGGIRGGISTGENLLIKVSFKPTSSILDVSKKGRHDPYIVTRAIPVLESMVALVLADHWLWSRTDKI